MSLVVICNDNIAYQPLAALTINKQVNNTTVFVEVFSNSKPPGPLTVTYMLFTFQTNIQKKIHIILKIEIDVNN